MSWPDVAVFVLGLLVGLMLSTKPAYDIGWYRGYEKGRVDSSFRKTKSKA